MRRTSLFNALCLGFCALILAACTPKKTEELMGPVDALGTVLAEKTAQLAGANKQVVIIAPDASWGPMSEAEKAFRAALKKQDLSVLMTKNVNLGDPMKSGTVGLKNSDFFEVMEKNPSAGAIVSFAGAPLFESTDGAKLAANHPAILVVATASLGLIPGVPGDRQTLTNLVEAKWIQLAIIDGSGNAASADGKSNAAHESFDQHFAVLSAAK